LSEYARHFALAGGFPEIENGVQYRLRTPYGDLRQTHSDYVGV